MVKIIKMNTLRFVGYFRIGFVCSFGQKRIQISDCREQILHRPTGSTACASGDDISIAAGWIRRSSRARSCGATPSPSPTAFGSRFGICRFASLNRQIRPIHDAQLQSAKHFSTVSFPCRTHQYLDEDKFSMRKSLPILFLARLCSSSSQPNGADQHHISVLQQLKKLENSLRFHGYSTLRIGLAIFIVIGMMVYLLREPIRENVAVEVSQVASRSLEHQQVAMKAEEFAKSLLQTLLHDENMHQLASQFIKQVLNSPETRKASIDYLSSILEDPQNRQLLASTVKQVLLLAIHDPETTAALKAVVVVILSDPESQKAARGLITTVFRHEELKAAAGLFFADVLKSEAVLTQATKLGKDVTLSVITDPNLKEETGKSFWQAVKYSVTPSWFSGTPSQSSPSPSPSQPTSEKPPTLPSSPSQESSLPPSSASSSSLSSSSSPSLPSSSPSSQTPSPPPPSSSFPTPSPPPPPPSSPASSFPTSSSPPPPPQPPSSPTSSPPPPPSPSPPSLSQTLSVSPSQPLEEIPAQSPLPDEEELEEEQLLDEDSNILT